MIVVYIDGLCEPRNPGGVGCYGVVIYRDGRKVRELCGVVGEGPAVSNNVAEYAALIAALRSLQDCTDEDIVVRSDSQLLVNQMNGHWQVNEGLYVPYYVCAERLSQGFKRIRYEWIPRELNTEADSLSRSAYDEYRRWSR